MPKKQIIALRGKSGVGKSTTLQLLYKMFLANYETKALHFEALGRKLDFLAIVSVHGVRVGLFNRGDEPNVVKQLLDRLVKERCQVILCAARSKGEVANVLASHKPTYGILQVPKKPAAAKSHSVSNHAAAHALAAMVYAAIDA